MDCRTAHMLLDVDRPWASELDAAEALALRDHLATCPACAARAEADRRVNDHLGRAIRDVPVPAGLRSRLAGRLAAERSVQVRRRVLRVAAVAAALLLALGLRHYWNLSRRPVVDTFAITNTVADRAFNSPEKVEAWFQEQGVAMVAPRLFNGATLNYTLLDSYGMADFQGVRVPQLLFFNQGTGASLARVLVLSDRSFNLDDAGVLTPAAGSSHRVEVFRHPEGAYVVIYTGQSLAPFFVAPQRGT